MLDGASLASHSSQLVERCSLSVSTVKDLVTDFSVDWVLKDLTLLHLTFWQLHINMFCPDSGSLPQSIKQWWRQLKHCWKEWGG